MYKQLKNIDGTFCNQIQRLSDMAIIPFDPANTDYQHFKKQINADEAQLEDADGNLMTAEQAKAYVATLP
jgi:hypothetical protein